MAKWQPPHPAKVITTPTRCKIAQRFNSVDRALAVMCGPLAPLTVKLRLAKCSWCQGGFHIVTAEELSLYRNALAEVPRG